METENQKSISSENILLNFNEAFSRICSPKIRRIMTEYQQEISQNIANIGFKHLKVRSFYFISRDEKVIALFTNVPGQFIGLHGDRIFKYQERLKKETGIEKIHLIEIF